jgi:hypothetical protein
MVMESKVIFWKKMGFFNHKATKNLSALSVFVVEKSGFRRHVPQPRRAALL